MGSFSLWHGIIVLIMLAIPVGIGLVIWLIVRAVRKPAVPAGPIPASGPPQSSAEARLRELASLRSKDLITESEYEEQRAEVLRSIQARA
ncbi:SHOCT domain-containing protein [Luteimonas sp. 100069]|uniref:SHOCT domain-containing protein n=1 Tax=Luteimonas sp. 100069 TaxID=2006109 RepID=UPI000F4FAE55|nr:SHOCT domain-containing protein [Luteimonas sp. 100069]RPD83470.1 hypothetical protein EGK76_15135 [Luteimonas sp. 100069]